MKKAQDFTASPSSAYINYVHRSWDPVIKKTPIIYIRFFGPIPLHFQNGKIVLTLQLRPSGFLELELGGFN